MNWIFEAYANAYSAATMMRPRHDGVVAPAKKPASDPVYGNADRPSK